MSPRGRGLAVRLDGFRAGALCSGDPVSQDTWTVDKGGTAMRRRWHWMVVAGLALGVTGCATTSPTQTTEDVLSQAGFRKLPADTPRKAEHLQTLPPLRLVGRTYKGTKYWVYADPQGCKCLYIGSAAQYKAYQGIVQQMNAPRWQPPAGVEEAREWEIENSGLQ
jgi:hypothetical protein